MDLLRCGHTSRVLGHRVLAPSTVGTFLRAFTFGHTRQLGYHPLLATRADTGEVLHTRLRTGRAHTAQIGRAYV